MSPERQRVAVNPELQQACSIISEAIARRMLLLVIGRFGVLYDGRARSTLEKGERLLIVKEDGAVLVHRKRDYDPVNWQASGSVVQVSFGDGVLRVRSVRKRPREVITMDFDRVHLVAGYTLEDTGVFALYASEEDMRDAVLQDSSLVEGGFLQLESERPVESGFVDLLGTDKDGNLVAVEFKREQATREAVVQLRGYVEELRRRHPDQRVRGILAAPSLGSRLGVVLKSSGLEFKRLDPKRCAQTLRRREPRLRLTEFMAGDAASR